MRGALVPHAMASKLLSLLAAAVLAGGCMQAATETREPIGSPGEKVVGYSFYPQRRTPTPERLSSLRLPVGFTADVFARDLKDARMMAVADDGAVYLTRPDQGDVLRILEGRAPATVMRGMDGVHGIAFHRGRLYLETIKELSSFALQADGSAGDRRLLVQGLPDAGQHVHRNFGFGPDGMLYLSIGSDCNVCSEPDPHHATMLRMKPDGSGRQVFAKGLRDTMGFAWHPDTRELWGMDHGMDWMGNDVPPEELNRIVEHGDYGWPFVWGNRQVNPLFERPSVDKADYAKGTVPAALTYQAHSAPIALAFYTGAQFPDDYKHDAFVAMHGSWNRSPAVGYAVVRIRFHDGRPLGFEDFLTGFLVEGGRAFFGRPAGLAVMKDGSLLVSDDANGVIYRIRYSDARKS
jgi:glucose/arabinose dehydrogenase